MINGSPPRSDRIPSNRQLLAFQLAVESEEDEEFWNSRFPELPRGERSGADHRRSRAHLYRIDSGRAADPRPDMTDLGSALRWEGVMAKAVPLTNLPILAVDE